MDNVRLIGKFRPGSTSPGAAGSGSESTPLLQQVCSKGVLIGVVVTALVATCAGVVASGVLTSSDATAAPATAAHDDATERSLEWPQTLRTPTAASTEGHVAHASAASSVGDQSSSKPRSSVPTNSTSTENTTAAAPEWREGFEPVDGGEGRECTAQSSEWENPFRIHRHVTSLEACQDVCRDSLKCAGVSHSEKSQICQVWTRPIDGSKAHKNKTCFRYNSSEFFPVKSGVGQACAAPKGTEGEEGKHYDSNQSASLYECKARCHLNTLCLGIDYDEESGVCNMWKMPVAGGMHAKGHVCLRRRPQGFKPVGHGLYRQCALDSGAKNQSKIHFGDHSLYECEARCAHGGARCKGINYNKDSHTCEMWTQQINTTRKAQDMSACFSYEAPPDDDSLYCVSLMLPSFENDPKLLKKQLEHKVGIFACDEFAVYSRPTVKIGHLETKDMIIDFEVMMDEERNEPTLRIGVYQWFWHHIANEGRYRDHDWVVKVDPDTVFFPERLRSIVRAHHPQSVASHNGLFLKNCPLKMRGSIQIMNSIAFGIYAAGAAGSCDDTELEAEYVEGCLLGLGVVEVDSFSTVADRECKNDDWQPNPDWEKCETAHASFHPFKDVSSYQACWERAMAADAWPPEELKVRTLVDAVRLEQ